MTVTAQSSKVSRRRVLGGALATGFVFAFHLPVGAAKASQAKDPADGKFAPNAYIRIDESGQVTLVMPQVEMGQGIYTGVATILAEELDADLTQVVLEHAPPDEKLYANPSFGIQATGGSTSVQGRCRWVASHAGKL
jgi:isoquinoline 1-oxidoreductase beta subunit